MAPERGVISSNATSHPTLTSLAPTQLTWFQQQRFSTYQDHFAEVGVQDDEFKRS